MRSDIVIFVKQHQHKLLKRMCILRMLVFNELDCICVWIFGDLSYTHRSTNVFVFLVFVCHYGFSFYIYIYMYTYTHTHTHTHVCVCVCVCKTFICVCITKKDLWTPLIQMWIVFKWIENNKCFNGKSDLRINHLQNAFVNPSVSIHEL